MEEFIQTFHIDWKLMIAQIINFGLVFLAFYLLAAKPLRKLMKERTEEIEKGLVDAKHNSEMLSLTQKEADDIISKARQEAHNVWKEAKEEADIKKTQMLDSAREEVQVMLVNTKKVLEAEKAKMIDDVKKEVVSLVVRATEKLLEDDMNSSFVDKQLKHIEKA